MYLRIMPRMLAGCCVLVFTAAASAQSVFSPVPTNLSPFARSVLNPYLMQNGNPTGNYSLRPFGLADNLVTPDATKIADNRAVGRHDLRDLDEKSWLERSRKMGPSGHPTGFLIQNPYFRLPNQRSFIPSNPSVGQPGQQPR